MNTEFEVQGTKSIVVQQWSVYTLSLRRKHSYCHQARGRVKHTAGYDESNHMNSKHKFLSIYLQQRGRVASKQDNGLADCHCQFKRTIVRSADTEQ